MMLRRRAPAAWVTPLAVRVRGLALLPPPFAPATAPGAGHRTVHAHAPRDRRHGGACKLPARLCARARTSPLAAGPGGSSFSKTQMRGEHGGHGQQAPSDSQQTMKMMVGIALGASALGAFFNIRAYERRRRREEEHGGGGEAQVKLIKGAAVGKPQLGGDYTLINHDGKVTRNSDFFGSWAFLYFGFTYCPDICPNELARLQEILALLDKENRGKHVQPVFITIDPERDGPAQLKDYLADWHPRLVGLTGSPAQIDECCKRFRVYANKVVLGKDPNDYLIDHSVMFYLIDPGGEFVDYYGGNLTPGEIAKRITASMQAYKGGV
jgi:protein SCO1/2